jgi:hypothetical protein
VRAIADAGIAVMGHIGLTPQALGQLGGYRVQGKTAAAVDRLIDDAQALEHAGAFSILLEAVPAEAAAAVRDRLSIPVYGIGPVRTSTANSSSRTTFLATSSARSVRASCAATPRWARTSSVRFAITPTMCGADAFPDLNTATRSIRCTKRRFVVRALDFSPSPPTAALALIQPPGDDMSVTLHLPTVLAKLADARVVEADGSTVAKPSPKSRRVSQPRAAAARRARQARTRSSPST